VHAEPDGVVRIELIDGEEGIATGQACVFYADAGTEAQVLGGGYIAKTIKSASPADYRVKGGTMAEARR
jgi:tRNA-specific 2-thiouridylase